MCGAFCKHAGPNCTVMAQNMIWLIVRDEKSLNKGFCCREYKKMARTQLCWNDIFDFDLNQNSSCRKIGPQAGSG